MLLISAAVAAAGSALSAGVSAAGQARAAGATNRKAAAQGLLQAALSVVPVAGQLLAMLGFLIKGKLLNEPRPDDALQAAAVAGMDPALMGALDAQLNLVGVGNREREELYRAFVASQVASDPAALEQLRAQWMQPYADLRTPDVSIRPDYLNVGWVGGMFGAGAAERLAAGRAQIEAPKRAAEERGAAALAARRPGWLALAWRNVALHGSRTDLAWALQETGAAQIEPEQITDQMLQAVRAKLAAAVGGTL